MTVNVPAFTLSPVTTTGKAPTPVALALSTIGEPVYANEVAPSDQVIADIVAGVIVIE